MITDRVFDLRKSLFWLTLAAVTLLGLWWSTMTAQAQSENVQQVEIREYQGEKLGSVDDFRENSIEGVQRIDPEAYLLRIDGLVEQTQSLTYATLQEMPHVKKLVTLHCVEGWSVTALWEGIPVSDLLQQVAPTAAAYTVIFHAHDGYTTSLPLNTIFERNLIIADRINDITLPPERGFPFQLVAEDKWGYKWIKWITRIELSNDPSYRGFWESRGYNNDGDLSGSMFGP